MHCDSSAAISSSASLQNRPAKFQCFSTSWVGWSLKLRSSIAESNRPLRATCTKAATPTWFAESIWTLLLFWPTVARTGQLDSALDERNFIFYMRATWTVYRSTENAQKVWRISFRLRRSKLGILVGLWSNRSFVYGASLPAAICTRHFVRHCKQSM